MAMVELARLKPRASTYVGLGVITLATLVYEVGLTRIFSATMWYHFAFVAISLALFGMTVGALVVFLQPSWFPEDRVGEQLWHYSLAFAVSLPLCFILQLSMPFQPTWGLAGLGSTILTCIVIAVPFCFSGVVVTLALTRFPRRVNRLYAADLLGAGIGCIGFVVLLRWLDGPSTVIAVGALGAISALLFAGGARNRQGLVASAAVVAVIGGFAALNTISNNHGHPLAEIVWTKGTKDVPHDYEHWNSISRIVVDGNARVPSVPAGFGMSSTLPASARVHQLVMNIDGAAATPLTQYNGNNEDTTFLRYDITNLGQYLVHDGNVFVVGVGGGRDVLSALQFNQRSVTGLEMNGDILKTLNGRYGNFTGHLDRNPRVHLVNDEARSYLTRTKTKYNMIQISFIDTWAAAAASAYSLTENSLYTTDALKVFFDHLEPNGILEISRWYQIGNLTQPYETYRVASLASQALKNEGVTDPRNHVLIYHAPVNGYDTSAATILIRPHDPFSGSDLTTVAATADRLQFPAVLTPTVSTDPVFAGLVRPAGPNSEAKRFDANIAPSTDGKPFFFQMADLQTFFGGQGFRDDVVTRPVLVLAILALVVIILALLFILAPVLIATRRQAHRSMSSLYVYFAGIGLGFLIIEVSQLERLSIFLGQPTYSLTVVLFSLLVASGIGSMFAMRFRLRDRFRGVTVPVMVVVVLVVYILLQPILIHWLSGAATPVRIAAAIGMLLPIGFFMGMPFSVGMRTATEIRPDAPTAFLWGINGATSVCASVVGILLAIFFGITTSFLVGIAAYGVATLALLRVRTTRQPEVVERPVAVSSKVPLEAG